MSLCGWKNMSQDTNPLASWLVMQACWVECQVCCVINSYAECPNALSVLFTMWNQSALSVSLYHVLYIPLLKRHCWGGIPLLLCICEWITWAQFIGTNEVMNTMTWSDSLSKQWRHLILNLLQAEWFCTVQEIFQTIFVYLPINT